MSDHHGMMIRFSLERLRFLEQQILQLDEQILLKIQQLGYIQEWELLQTIPGFQHTSAANVLVEVGPNMQQFASERHISSWAGICPGNNRTAGKDKGSKPTRGNRWLRAALTECAWAVSTKKNGALKEKFWLFQWIDAVHAVRRSEAVSLTWSFRVCFSELILYVVSWLQRGLLELHS